MWKMLIKYIEFTDSMRRVRISSSVTKTFKKYEQRKGKLESGGILLGHVYSDYDYITKVTVPNEYDSSEHNCFNRSRIPAQAEINRVWKKSYGSLIYLGEWHSHRDIHPTPSTTDVEMIKTAFNETEMEIAFLYLIIVGLRNTYWAGRQTFNGLTRFNRVG